MAARARPVSPRVIVVLGITLLAGLLAVFAVHGAVSTSSLPDAVPITDVPDSYRITYEVRAASGTEGDETISTEIMQADRPFRSLVVTKTGAPPGGDLVSGRVSDLNRLLVFGDGRWTELQIPPAMAASDLRLDGVLDDAVAAGHVDRRGDVRRIAGHACQVHRFGGPIDGGELTPVDASGGEHADVCIDEHGLVLEEVWTKDGRVLRRRTAVDVDVDSHFAPDTFDVADAEPVPAASGGGAVRRVTDDSRFGDHTWELPRPPKGFEHLGRWTVIRPRLNANVDPLASPSSDRVAGIATVWRRGHDALVVEQGASSGGGRAFEPNPAGERVDLGALDVGEVITDGRGTEVRVAYVDGSFVRVWSTLPRADVIAIARRLKPGPGGRPVPLD